VGAEGGAIVKITRWVSGASYARAKRNILQRCFGDASRRVLPGDARAAAADAMEAKLVAAYRKFFDKRLARI